MTTRLLLGATIKVGRRFLSLLTQMPPRHRTPCDCSERRLPAEPGLAHFAARVL